MDIKIKYLSEAPSKEVCEAPCLILGQLVHLKEIQFSDFSRRFGKVINQDSWSQSLEALDSSSINNIGLHLNEVTVGTLPVLCSRHNTPSRGHSITKMIKNWNPPNREIQRIIIVCEKSDAFASGCAVSRAFPLFCRKTPDQHSKASSLHNVYVEFLFRGAVNNIITVEEANTIENAVRGIQLSARIVDTPCNEMHVNAFLEEIRTIGKDLGISPLIIQGEDLKKAGLGGIYGVGKAAENLPALAVLSHTPTGATQTVAWVGKGIVYDTGGLSIKGKTAMPGMKRDCGGAAGILGAFYSTVKTGFNQNLHAVFCLAENSVGPKATRPDDIHILYSGRSVEINNTDAEGRLVVSDGVVYAQKNLGADIILDMCTLTGSQGITTGRYHSGFLTNKEEWEDKCFKAGRASGDLAFPMVYCPELHFSEFNSPVADMKNSVADRTNALSSCAGLFINAHLGFSFSGTWLHFDIAAPAFSGERATGYGVALLNVLFGNFSKSQMLSNASSNEA